MALHDRDATDRPATERRDEEGACGSGCWSMQKVTRIVRSGVVLAHDTSAAVNQLLGFGLRLQ
jgi:hypothetical protein